MSEVPFIELEHTADWSMRVRAADFEGLLVNAALGMFQLMGIQWENDTLGEKEIGVDGQDRETLLVTWLEELLFQIEIHNVAIIIDHLSVDDDQTKLKATVSEFPISRLDKVIKAVTYHQLRVIELDEGLEVTIVFDV